MNRIAIAFLMITALLISCASTYETPVTTGASTQAPTVSAESQTPAEPAVTTAPVETAPEVPLEAVNAKGQLEGVDKSTEVVGYRVKGHSEEGDNFDWISVQSSQIVLSNITQGHWTLEIEAVDKNGNVLYSGRIVRELSKETENDGEIVNFVKNQSNGCASVDYRWNAALVNAPQLEVWIKKVGDKEYKKCPANEVEFSIGGATWKNTSLPTGTYIVKAILKDSGYVISGVASTLSVYENLESTGSATLHINPFIASFDLSALNATPVVIELALEQNNVIAKGAENLSYVWFVDGEELTETNDTVNIAGYVGSGKHRIDCIATDGNTVCSKHIFISSVGNNIIVAQTEDLL